MNVWWCLFKKEFRLVRSFLIVNGLALITVGIIGAYLAYRLHSGVPSLFLFITMAWHSLYLLVYLLISLRAERNNAPIWMQSPQSALLLLSAKFAAGLVMLCASLTLNLAIWLWVLHLDFQSGWVLSNNHFRFLLPIADLIKQHWSLLALVFTQKALWLAALGTFIYFFAGILKHWLRGWRWILCLILFIATLGVTGWFSHTAVYDALFHWGKVDIFDFSAFAALDPNSNTHFPRNHWKSGWPLYFGDIVYGLLLSVIWFNIAAWLLDRKVEV